MVLFLPKCGSMFDASPRIQAVRVGPMPKCPPLAAVLVVTFCGAPDPGRDMVAALILSLTAEIWYKPGIQFVPLIMRISLPVSLA